MCRLLHSLKIRDCGKLKIKKDSVLSRLSNILILFIFIETISSFFECEGMLLNVWIQFTSY